MVLKDGSLPLGKGSRGGSECPPAEADDAGGLCDHQESREAQKLNKKQQKEQLYEAYNLLHSLAQVSRP